MKQVLLPFAVVLSFAAHAQERKTITHEDLWTMPRVGAPLASPDGKLALFAVTEPVYKKDESVSDLWVVPTDASAPAYRITADKAGESTPGWSADSRRIVFSAKRGDDKQPQLYVLDLVRGGEAQRVTKLSTGAGTPAFSPDGSRLLFSSRVYRDSKNDADNERLAKEEEEQKYKARVYTSFPIRFWDKWLDDKQSRLFVQPIGKGEARDLLAGSALIKLAGYSLADNGALWTVDGKSVVFVASRNRDRSAWSFTHSDLFVVSADGGEPRRLTGADALDAADSYASPRFSRDGKTLLATIEPMTGKVYNANRIAVFEWPSMRERARIELPDRHDIGSFDIAPDGRSVFITSEDAGQEKLYQASTSGGVAKLVGAPTHGTYANLSIGGTRTPVLLASYESASEPAEIVRLDVAGKAAQRLTSFSVAKAATLDLAAVENFWFDNTRGQRVHSMLVRPPHFDAKKKYPLLVLMHGGPYSQWRDQFVLRWNYHLLGAQGYVVLMTNYVGSTGFGETFSQAIEGDPLKGPADDINQAADEAIKRFSFIDAGRQCAAGASYGGHLANWMQGTTTRYRCLVSHAGMINIESQWGTSDGIYGREVSAGGPVWEQSAVWREQNPIRLAAHFKTPVLVSFGEKDFRVPLNNGLEYWAALQRQKVESKFIVFPEENHWVLNGENSKFFYKEVQGWLGKYLDTPAAK